jgi:ketosteroid isomerase-like protein
MSRENVDAARRSFDVEFFSEIARRVEGAETVIRGTAEMHRFWDEWHLVWDMRIDVSEVRDLGHTVLVLGRIRAHGEASGIDLEGPIAYVFEFDGRLARTVRAYLDPQQALDAVGLS